MPFGSFTTKTARTRQPKKTIRSPTRSLQHPPMPPALPIVDTVPPWHVAGLTSLNLSAISSDESLTNTRESRTLTLTPTSAISALSSDDSPTNARANTSAISALSSYKVAGARLAPTEKSKNASGITTDLSSDGSPSNARKNTSGTNTNNSPTKTSNLEDQVNKWDEGEGVACDFAFQTSEPLGLILGRFAADVNGDGPLVVKRLIEGAQAHRMETTIPTGSIVVGVNGVRLSKYDVALQAIADAKNSESLVVLTLQVLDANFIMPDTAWVGDDPEPGNNTSVAPEATLESLLDNSTARILASAMVEAGSRHTGMCCAPSPVLFCAHLLAHFLPSK
jgi:hypothetical protein